MKREVIGAVMPKRLMIWALALILLLGAFPLLSLLLAVFRFDLLAASSMKARSIHAWFSASISVACCIQWRSVAGSLCSQYRSLRQRKAIVSR